MSVEPRLPIATTQAGTLLQQRKLAAESWVFRRNHRCV